MVIRIDNRCALHSLMGMKEAIFIFDPFQHPAWNNSAQETTKWLGQKGHVSTSQELYYLNGARIYL